MHKAVFLKHNLLSLSQKTPKRKWVIQLGQEFSEVRPQCSKECIFRKEGLYAVWYPNSCDAYFDNEANPTVYGNTVDIECIKNSVWNLICSLMQLHSSLFTSLVFWDLSTLRHVPSLSRLYIFCLQVLDSGLNCVCLFFWCLPFWC